jgi:metal-responsive CopG/Arc/MetJ family transcriptional regulator
VRKHYPIEKMSISIRGDLLKHFREIYNKQSFKGDSEAVCYLIRKHCEMLKNE